MLSLYVTHPQVRMDAAVPVPLWGLSDVGRQRAEAFAGSGVVPPGALIFSSRERKAVELADMLAAAAGTLALSDHLMGENDRSATGFLPPALFEETADKFFAQPEESVEGWERAIDAQRRIVQTVETALAGIAADMPVVFCGHGAVGTLLKCHLAGRPIDRREDQPGSGGGNCFVFDLVGRRLLSEWTPMEAMAPGWADGPVAAAELLP